MEPARTSGRRRAGSMSRDSIQLADRYTADRQAEGHLHFKADEEPDCQAEDVLNRQAENDPGCHARSLDRVRTNRRTDGGSKPLAEDKACHQSGKN
jgi:hypothetical protein